MEDPLKSSVGESLKAKLEAQSKNHYVTKSKPEQTASKQVNKSKSPLSMSKNLKTDEKRKSPSDLTAQAKLTGLANPLTLLH